MLLPMLGVWWEFIMDKEWICALSVKLLEVSRFIVFQKVPILENVDD